MVIQGIAETEKYLRFDYVVFRKGQGHAYTLAGSGMARGLPRQTLKIIQDRARRFIEEDLGGWDAGAMRAHISIYEVPSPNPFVETMADFWQPTNDVHRTSRRKLEHLQPTSSMLGSNFVQRSTDVELDQIPSVLLVTFDLRASAGKHDCGAGNRRSPSSLSVTGHSGQK